MAPYEVVLALVVGASLMFVAPRGMDVPVALGRAELHRFGFLPMPTPRATDDSGSVPLYAALIFVCFRFGIPNNVDAFPPD